MLQEMAYNEGDNLSEKDILKYYNKLFNDE